jgi:hypothetical protein
MGAAQKRRGNIKGHQKGRFRKCDGKPDDWMVWMEENKPNELEALEKQRSARLGGKGRFRKDEGKPHDWTAWEKEHQAAELEASETRRSAISGGTSHSAKTISSVSSTHTPVVQQHHIVPVVASTSIPLPTATGMTLSDFTMSVDAKMQDMAKADEDTQDRLRRKPDDDQQTRDERRAEEIDRSEAERPNARNDSQWEDYLAQETAPEKPQVGDRVCVVCQRHRSNAQSRCECNERQYWTIPERAWIEAVARLKGLTTRQGHVRSGPRSGLPTGNPLSEEEKAVMPRNYSREQGATWEHNDYVKEMTSLLRVKLTGRSREEEAARSARGDHDVQMSDANATAGRSMTAVPATTPFLEIDIICGEERIPWVRLHGDTQNSDMIQVGGWYCNCGKWRRPIQEICQRGASERLKVTFLTNTDGLVRSGQPPQDPGDNPDEASSDDAW